ncbi:MAG: oligosaccharide flippase family protein, partial [Roseivirga sp.]|uniref:lipopolysaccharide biosynthesis protein n=1 Tax=Roseivirga sp. TaxID=1964215 RepID=UPI001B1D9448
IFFSSGAVNLKVVGLANIISSSLHFVITLILFLRHQPIIDISLRFFRLDKLGSMFKMGGWLIVGQLGFLLFTKIDLIIINRMLGATASGQYGVIQQWGNLIRSLIAVLSGVIAPVILIFYSQGKRESVYSYSLLGVKGTGILLALTCGVLCGLSEPLLQVWISEEYGILSRLLQITLAPLTVNLAVLPLFSINKAHNAVKIPGIVTVLAGTINVVLAYYALKIGLGLEGVVYASAIMLTLKNVLFTPLYTMSIIQMKINSVYFALFKSTLLFGFVWFLTYVLAKFWIDTITWGSLVVTAVIVLVLSAPISLFLVFNLKERHTLINYTSSLIKQRIK